MTLLLAIHAFVSLAWSVVFVYAAWNGIHITTGQYYFDFVGLKNMDKDKRA